MVQGGRVAGADRHLHRVRQWRYPGQPDDAAHPDHDGDGLESARQRSDYGERCHGPELHDYFHRRHADYYARTLDPPTSVSLNITYGYRTLDPLKRHGLPRLRGLTRHNHVIGRWTH